MAEIIIAKHRNGAVGDVLLTFKGQYTRFQNPEDDANSPSSIPPPTDKDVPYGAEANGNIPPISGGDFPPPPDMPFAPPTLDKADF